MIRHAKAGDIPRLRALIGEMYAASKYAGVATLAPKLVQSMLWGSIQHQGSLHVGGTLVLVSEVGGVIEAFVIGELAPVYGIGVELMAFDRFFWVTDRAPPGTAIAFRNALHEWAYHNPQVIEATFGCTNAIRKDFQRAGEVLWGNAGYELSGVMYEAMFDRKKPSESEAA